MSNKSEAKLKRPRTSLTLASYEVQALQSFLIKVLDLEVAGEVMSLIYRELRILRGHLQSLEKRLKRLEKKKERR